MKQKNVSNANCSIAGWFRHHMVVRPLGAARQKEKVRRPTDQTRQ